MPEFKYIASLATWAAISPPTIADKATKITDDNNAVVSVSNAFKARADIFSAK
jgi:hypothetical protein